jgi:hypothetical protein
MIALTARLNERDDQIIQLQTEQDALERINKDQCTEIDAYRARNYELEQILAENGIKTPTSVPGRKLSAGLDHGRRYLPYSQTAAITDELLDGQEERIEFLTPDEKVDEL